MGAISTGRSGWCQQRLGGIATAGADVMSVANGPRLTVVAPGFPPQVMGSAILLANLLSDYRGHVRAIAGYEYYAKSDPMFLPPCPVKYLALPRIHPRFYGGLRRRF